MEDEVESALARILGGDPAKLTVAGRTDAGVHALGQVASFESSRELPDRLAERLNAVLPRDVAVLAAGSAPDGFDARGDARSRVYRYRILAAPARDPFEEGRALWWPHPLDIQRLRACAEATIGEHDFTAFTPTVTDHVRFHRRVIGCRWTDEPALAGELLALEIEADAFMRHMVRVLVGTMLEVGAGRRPVDGYRALLAGAPRDRAGETTPPHGLYLVAVRY